MTTSTAKPSRGRPHNFLAVLRYWMEQDWSKQNCTIARLTGAGYTSVRRWRERLGQPRPANDWRKNAE